MSAFIGPSCFSKTVIAEAVASHHFHHRLSTVREMTTPLSSPRGSLAHLDNQETLQLSVTNDDFTAAIMCRRCSNQFTCTVSTGVQCDLVSSELSDHDRPHNDIV